jgi:hypothetical protein
MLTESVNCKTTQVREKNASKHAIHFMFGLFFRKNNWKLSTFVNSCSSLTPFISSYKLQLFLDLPCLKYPHNTEGTLRDSCGHVFIFTAGVTYLNRCRISVGSPKIQQQINMSPGLMSF